MEQMSKTIEWKYKVAYLQAKHAIALAREWDKKTDWNAKEKQLDESYRLAMEKPERKQRSFSTMDGEPADDIDVSKIPF